MAPEVYDFTHRLEAIEAYAAIASTTSIYGARDGQFSQTKRKRDEIVGKAAEWVVYDTLVSRFPDLTEPDMNHYTACKKSWKHDLSCSEFYISVKGQDVVQGNRYGTSWVFQRTDKGLIPLEKPTYIACISIDVENHKGIIQAILSLDSVVFGEMKLPQHRKNKVAVYLKDQGENLWQIP